MSRPRSLTNLLLDVRSRTNQENSTFVTDAELTEYLNQELAELWGRLVINQGQPHLRSQTEITVVAGVSVYALPTDFWTLQEITATVGGVTAPMMPFMPTDRGWLVNSLAIAPFTGARYRLQAQNVEFQPATQSFTATVFYTPSCPRLVDPSDMFEGFNGYEVAAIYGVCATVLQKEESDPSFYMSSKSRILNHIDQLSAHRDMANPERVQDVTGSSDRLDWPGAGYGWWP